MEISAIHDVMAKVRQNVENVIIGKSAAIDITLSTLLASGHVLLEDVPGTGKTMLAKALAHSFSCAFGRIQFTPDLLPSDLTGINFYNPKSGTFSFRKGSLFTNILLADEINRATPRTQAGLLESMEERQITVDGTTYPLTPPYFVIATQNPVETQGTFPLPEAQLDRFLVQLSLGYPSATENAAIIRRFITSAPMETLQPVCSTDTWLEAQQAVKQVFIHEEVYMYITRLAEATRSHNTVILGVSPRGCIALARLAQAFAALNGKDFVTPGDIKHLLPYVFGHRLILKSGIRNRANAAGDILRQIADSLPAPVEDWGNVRTAVQGGV